MEKNYYFVLEPGGAEDGPYMLLEIGRRYASGLVSTKASLCRAGETTWQPIDAPQFQTVFAKLPPPVRTAAGTSQQPVIVDAPSVEVAREEAPAPPPALAVRTVEPPKAKLVLPRPMLIGGAGALVVGAAAIALLALRGSDDTPQIKDAMVRVSTANGTGAGFFIAGPDRFAYVATANHLVDRGDRILVERDVELTDKQHFVEAYPETEIVASDPDADLAIIRIKNVDGKRFARLPLAKEPTKDAKIYSYGYPGSNLAKRAGLVSKDGKILSLVMFPAYDDRYARVLRENAVDGLLISNDIEPGMSGGPTTNDAGHVVGVNVTKDRAHVGQNGAVSVLALRSLLARVKPATQQVELDPEDVVALLERIEREYLLLPVDERAKVRETDFLAASDLPRIRRFVGEIRREERNTETAFNKLQLSGQAALGIFFARLPGKLLETYRSPSTKTPLAKCELANQRLAGFLHELDTSDRSLQPRAPKLDTCDDLAVRPLAWDLAAATVQWDGTEKEYAVTKLDRMDDEGRTYRAQVRITGATNLVEIWVGIEQGQPRLRLFDTTENLYAIASPRNVPATAMQGTWLMKRPRVTDAIDKQAEIESDETLSISIGDERRVSIRHVITQRYFVAGNRGVPFKCNRKNTIETGLLQSFVGTIENGVVVALPEKPAESIGADAGACIASHRPDRIVAVKLVGTQLFLYRTDGSAYPETLQFAKE
jgi:S1-C subfamily serine protease